jgi:MFS family permease
LRPGASLAVLLTASTGCAMTVLDTNVVAVVLPTIARDLGASFADVEWVVSTYVLCFAALLLPAGSIADRFGRRKVFLGGIGFYPGASEQFRSDDGCCLAFDIFLRFEFIFLTDAPAVSCAGESRRLVKARADAVTSKRRYGCR